MQLEIFLNPLIGGAIIGLAASLLLLFNGRIFGVTGVLSGAIWSYGQDKLWRIAAIVGLFLGSWLTSMVAPNLFDYKFETSLWPMALAGVFVGFGTRLGSGCTSGHGICGLPRFSMRSLIAVMTFMATGAITTYIIRHIL